MSDKLSNREVERVQKLVNKWFDKQNYLNDPNDILHKWLNEPKYFPDGHPMFKPDFDWSGQPTPTFLWEGCPIEDWVDKVAFALNPKLTKSGIILEPYASWALSIYKW